MDMNLPSNLNLIFYPLAYYGDSIDINCSLIIKLCYNGISGTLYMEGHLI